MYAVRYIQLFTAACTIGVFGLMQHRGNTTLDALSTVGILSASWLAGIYSSLAIYRLFFHPLKKFPGPFAGRLGQLWLSAQLGNRDLYHQLQAMHRKYGRYVRIGPNELSISDPDIMRPAYGPQSKVIKDAWYDYSYPTISILFTRDPGVHDLRRRIWAPAFSDRAVRDYESVVKELNGVFLRRLSEVHADSINASTWFNLYSFDIVGRLAFGTDYAMLQSGERHWALDLLTQGLEKWAFKLPAWLFRVMLAVPGLASGSKKYRAFVYNELKTRVQDPDKKGDKDITGWLESVRRRGASGVRCVIARRCGNDHRRWQ